MPYYTVKQGEWVSKIASRYGLTWETLRNHPENAHLRRKRQSPNVIHPGDKLFVPSPMQRHEYGETGRRYIFRLKGRRTQLRVQLEAPDGSPLAQKRFSLSSENESIEGTTSDTGHIDSLISNETQRATLTVWRSDDAKDRLTFNLRLGHLDPETEITGIQARLNNLGYPVGAVDGILSPRTRTAIRTFRMDYNLPEDDDVDDKLLLQLLDEHTS